MPVETIDLTVNRLPDFPTLAPLCCGYTTSMRIAIDIRRMYEFGLATYIRNVVRTLGRIDPVNEYFLVGAARAL